MNKRGRGILMGQPSFTNRVNPLSPNYRIKYGDNIRALVTYLNVVLCIPFKRIAELISDLSGRKINEGTVQNILKV